MPQINDSGSRMVNHEGQEVDDDGVAVGSNEDYIKRTVTPYIQARHPGVAPEELAYRLRGELRPQIRPSPETCKALIACLSREFPGGFTDSGEYREVRAFLAECAKPLPRWMFESSYTGHHNFNAAQFRHYLVTIMSLMLKVDERHKGEIPESLVLFYGKILLWRTDEMSRKYV